MKLIKTLIFLSIPLFWNRLADAATVTEISKKSPTIRMSADASETFEPKDKICLYSKNKTRITCGVVKRVKGGNLDVKISKREHLDKLPVGTEVELRKYAGKKAGDGQSEIAAPTKSRSKNPIRLAFNYDAALVLPASFNQVAYVPPQESPAQTLWTSDSVVSSFSIKFLSLAGELGIPVGSKGISLGGRFQQFQSSDVSSDYDKDLDFPFVRTITSATAFGAWADFVYLRKSSTKTLAFNLFNGLGFDQYSVTVRATKISQGANAGLTTPGNSNREALLLVDATPEGSPMISGTAKLGFISLRAGIRTDLQLASHVGLSAGATAVIPLFAPLNSVTADVGEGEDRGVADPQADLKSGIKLTKKSFGLDVLIGAYASF